MSSPSASFYVEEQDLKEKVPLEPFEHLAYMLERYCIISSNTNNRKQAAIAFLRRGEAVDLPDFFINAEEPKPYRIYPTAACNVINACVRFLEQKLHQQIKTGNVKTSPEEIGAACLADQLFSSACSSPDGKFTIHWIRKNTKELILNPHGRRVKQLASRLEKWRIAKQELDKSTPLPKLNAKKTFEHEARISFQQWKIIDPEKWGGQRPWEISVSLDQLKENLGFEARDPDEAGPLQSDESSYQEEGTSLWGSERDAIGYFEANQIAAEEEIDQANWLGINIPFSLKHHEIQKGNVLTTSPTAWLWRWQEHPLHFLVNYVSSEVKPCLEEASALLAKAREEERFQELGSQALIVNPDNKRNPESFWELMKSSLKNFSSQRPGPLEETFIRKLDCARFYLALQATNRRFGIDPLEFEQLWAEKIHNIMDNEEKRTKTTRNQLLLETLKEIKSVQNNNSWNAQRMEQWLEFLQTMGPGAYENSLMMEEQRKELLTNLNLAFRSARSSLAASSPEETKKTGEAVHQTLKKISDRLYSYLSGASGQITRRELRTKITQLKTLAEQKGNTKLADTLKEQWKFLSSISGKIKSGEWYEKGKEHREKIFEILLTILENPSGNPTEFEGSKEPEPRDPAEICIEFLKSYSLTGCEVPLGSKVILESIETVKEQEAQEKNSKAALAIRKITKTRPKSNKTPANIITLLEERSYCLEGALALIELLETTNDPIKTLIEKIHDEIEFLRNPPQDTELLAQEQTKRAKNSLKFWKGVHYLIQNIQSRREEEKYQPTPSARGTIQNLIALAKARLINKTIGDSTGKPLKQFSISKTREKSLTQSVAVPLALWIKKPEKGTKTKISHKDYVQTLKDRLLACQTFLEESRGEKTISEEVEIFEKKSRLNKNLLNSFLLEECIAVLENEKDLSETIQWETENPSLAKKLQQDYPQADTPQKKLPLIKRLQSPSKEEEILPHPA